MLREVSELKIATSLNVQDFKVGKKGVKRITEERGKLIVWMENIDIVFNSRYYVGIATKYI